MRVSYKWGVGVRVGWLFMAATSGKDLTVNKMFPGTYRLSGKKNKTKQYNTKAQGLERGLRLERGLSSSEYWVVVGFPSALAPHWNTKMLVVVFD